MPGFSGVAGMPPPASLPAGPANAILAPQLLGSNTELQSSLGQYVSGTRTFIRADGIQIPNSPTLRSPTSASGGSNRDARALSLLRRKDGGPVASVASTPMNSWEVLGPSRNATAASDTSLRNRTKSLIAKFEVARVEPVSAIQPPRRMSTGSMPRAQTADDDVRFYTPTAVSGLPNAQAPNEFGPPSHGLFHTTQAELNIVPLGTDTTAIPGLAPVDNLQARTMISNHESKLSM